MAEIRNQTVTGRVALDGASFFNCDFNDVDLTYEGGLPPAFDNCRFDNARFQFHGPAGATLMFLRAMAPANTNMRQVVQGLIPELAD